jgi:hypothetical protein
LLHEPGLKGSSNEPPLSRDRFGNRCGHYSIASVICNERIGRAPAGGLINTGGLFFFFSLSLVYKEPY